MFVQMISSEPQNILLPNLVWLCSIMSQSVKQKSWFSVFNVKVTARLYIIKTLQWGAADTEIKSHLVRAQSLNVLPLKPAVGQYIAVHAKLTARDFFFAYFYPSSPFTCIFSKASPNFFLCWLWLTPAPV